MSTSLASFTLPVVILGLISLSRAAIVEEGDMRQTYDNHRPAEDWKCATGFSVPAADYIQCLSHLDCHRRSCNAVVMNKTNSSCCSVAAPYDWIVSNVGSGALVSQPDANTYLVMRECVREAVWPPAIAVLLDQTNGATNLGYLSDKVKPVTNNNVNWTDDGPRPHEKSGDGKYADFHYSRNSYIKLQSSAALNFDSGFTIAFWITMRNAKSTRASIIEFFDGSSRGIYFWLYPSTYPRQLYVRFSTSHYVYTGSNVVQNNGPWVHLAAVWSPASQTKITVNGMSTPLYVYGDRTVAPYSNRREIYLGRMGTSSSYYFTGSMACVFIYEKALSDDDLKQVMTLC